MAIQQAVVSLTASGKGTTIVSESNFLLPLLAREDSKKDVVLDSSAPGLPFRSGYITFIDENVMDYIGQKYPDSYVTNIFKEKLNDLEKWINMRRSILLEMHAKFDLQLLIELVIHSGQMDLWFSAELLSSCGKAGVPVKILSNL